jgi:DNA topoisomerase-3
VLDAVLTTDPTLRPLLDQLDPTQRSRAWNDSKVSAHHGIIPALEPANLSAMSDKEIAVYKLIRAHYLAQFLPHHEFDRTTAQLLCGDQYLQAIGKQVIIPGWHQVLAVPEADETDRESTPGSQVLPAMHEGLPSQIGHIDLKSLETQPPKPYTQGDLVKP